MKKTVIGSGVYVLDTIVVREYPAWPQPRPFVDRTVIEEIGGTCGNVMCMLSWLGWKAMPQIMLDDSPEGLKMTGDLKRYGCDCQYVTNPPEGGTTLLRCTHQKDADGNHTRRRPFWKSWTRPPGYTSSTIPPPDTASSPVPFGSGAPSSTSSRPRS